MKKQGIRWRTCGWKEKNDCNQEHHTYLRCTQSEYDILNLSHETSGARTPGLRSNGTAPAPRIGPSVGHVQWQRATLASRRKRTVCVHCAQKQMFQKEGLRCTTIAISLLKCNFTIAVSMRSVPQPRSFQPGPHVCLISAPTFSTATTTTFLPNTLSAASDYLFLHFDVFNPIQLLPNLALRQHPFFPSSHHTLPLPPHHSTPQPWSRPPSPPHTHKNLFSQV